MITTTIAEGFELSPQQRYLCSRELPGSSYAAQCMVALEGELSIEGLREALRQVIARHEILRTTFPRVYAYSPPVQTIGDSDTGYEWHFEEHNDGEPQEGTSRDTLARATRRPTRRRKWTSPARYRSEDRS